LKLTSKLDFFGERRKQQTSRQAVISRQQSGRQAAGRQDIPVFFKTFFSFFHLFSIFHFLSLDFIIRVGHSFVYFEKMSPNNYYL
jgi:hypothetical protein